MRNEEELMTTLSPGRTIFKASTPAVITIMVMMIYNMADMFFIGKTGDAMQVAAVALSAPVMAILSGLGTLLGSGGCAGISNELGRKNYEKAKHMSSFSLYSAIAAGLLFSVIFLVFHDPILSLIGTSPSTSGYTGSYLSIIALGAPVITFANTSSNIIRAEGAVKQSMLGNSLGSIINIILDPIFILVLDMGIEGAAIATILGNLSAALYFIWYFHFSSKNLSYSPKYFTLRKDISLKIISLGLPTTIGILLMSFSNILKNNLVAGYGDFVIAAMGVASRATMFVGMLQMGLGIGIQPVIGYNYGAKNFPRIDSILKRTIAITAGIGALLTLAVLFGRSTFIRIFIDDPQVIEYGQWIVLISVITGPIAGLNYISTMFLQATDKPSHATAVSLLRQGVFFLPLMYLLNHLAGLEGLIFSVPLANILATALGATLMLIQRRKLKRDLGTD